VEDAGGTAGHQAGAKHDLLLAQQADGAEGAHEVVVVNVGRDAVVLLVHVHDRRVRLQLPATFRAFEY